MSQTFRFSPLPTIKELLNLYNLRALKKLSQNFILDRSLSDKIANVPKTLDDYEVCEIGPGPGGITRSLLMRNPRKVFGVEKDTRFEPILEALQNTAKGKLHVIYGDILHFNFTDIFDPSLKKDWEDEPPKIHIIGNLPFNVSNVLIFQFLKDISLRRNAWSYGRVCLTLTFQDEVAQRIISNILERSRSGISIMCQNWCKIEKKYFIKGHAFLPKAKVNAGVLHFEPLRQPIIDLEFHFVEKFFRTIFNCRQKYCINTARKLFPKESRKKLVEEMFRMVNFDPMIRPYQITNEEFKSLIYAYKHICDRDPRLYNYNYRDRIISREKTWKEESSQKMVAM